MIYIYRDFHLPRLSKDACDHFLQAVAVSRCSIVVSHVMTNGFSESSINRWEMWFKLQFTSETDLEKFHECGLKTTQPEQITGH